MCLAIRSGRRLEDWVELTHRKEAEYEDYEILSTGGTVEWRRKLLTAERRDEVDKRLYGEQLITPRCALATFFCGNLRL